MGRLLVLSLIMTASTLICGGGLDHEVVFTSKPQAGNATAREKAFASFEAAERLRREGTTKSLRDSVLQYQEALALYRGLSNSGKMEALIHYRLGVIHHDLGEHPKALDHYSQALKLKRPDDLAGRAELLDKIGVAYESGGNYEEALRYYRDQALPLWNSLPDANLQGRAETLYHLGGIYHTFGEYHRALDFYSQARSGYQVAEVPTGLAHTLRGIGKVYIEVGEHDSAIKILLQTLKLYQQQGDSFNEAATLTTLGLASHLKKDFTSARIHYESALRLHQGSEQSGWERATILNNIGAVLNDLGDTDAALAILGQALELNRHAGNALGEAFTWKNFGKVHHARGSDGQAVECLSRALTLSRQLRFRPLEAQSLYLIARVENDRGALAAARTLLEEAIGIVESLRTKIDGVGLRASYFATVRDFYDLYIDVLMRLHAAQPSEGFDSQALQASERSRARALLDTLAEAGADIRQGANQELVERERYLRRRLNAIARQQMALTGSRGEVEQADSIAIEIDDLTNQLQRVESEIKQASPRYAALTQPRPLDLRAIQDEVLDDDSLLLEYFVGAERSYLWAVTKTSMKSYELPKREEIEAVARQFYNELAYARVEKRRRRAWDSIPVYDLTPESATTLSKMILPPGESPTLGRRLLIVADGVLQFIPFGALPCMSCEGRRQDNGAEAAITERPIHAAGEPLLTKHEIVNLPSASAMLALRCEVEGRKAAPKALAVLADPVFSSDDIRLTRSAGIKLRRRRASGAAFATGEAELIGTQKIFERLPGTGLEANNILALIPPNERKRAVGFDASRETALSPDLGRYRYVHFATHGLLNSKHPGLSGLILSMYDRRGVRREGFLRAHEVYNLRLPAELVVLSACKTGLGKEIKGEGLVGLTRGFMYAGAARVVVSLWDVDDLATAEFMSLFYKAMLGKRMTPAQALRAAQIEMRRTRPAPYYWAAFTIQGEWRHDGQPRPGPKGCSPRAGG